jgi:hypothetical protein
MIPQILTLADILSQKKIDTRKEKLNSIQELEKILTELTHIVKKEKYEPIPITEIKPVGNTVYN